VLDEIGDKSLINRIILTGYIPNASLPAVYSQCKVFLYTSLRESFGIPMLEAMKCGVPVLTSNTESMPEIAGDAAYLVNPFKHQEITEAMIKMVQDESLRTDLISKGLLRAPQFSWEITARKVLESYQKLGAD
jgi:glycosyltransferase involved in cell wall biosynthesis